MLVRTKEGKLIEIIRTDYTSDYDYFQTIKLHLSGKQISQNKNIIATLVDKVIERSYTMNK